MLQVLNKHILVVVDHHTGVQDVVGVESIFDPFHQRIYVASPFSFHKRSHVATGAMFGFEASFMLHCDQFAQILHERGIFLYPCRRVDIGKYGKMHIAIEQVTPHHRIGIATLYEQVPHIGQRITQYLTPEGNILDDAGRMGWPCGGGGSKQAVADVPVEVVKMLVGRELDGRKGGEVCQFIFYLLHLSPQGLLIVGSGVNQQCSRSCGQQFQLLRHAGVLFHGTQGVPVHQLRRAHLTLP